MLHRRNQHFSSRFRSALTAVALATGLAAGLNAAPAHASDPVAADGSVGVNTQWENGQSSTWFIELQRYGEYDITQGVESENDSMIRAGMIQFDWGFKQQAASGEFVGTAGGQTGQEFHSTSLFIEAVARCTMLLKNYNPTTYTKSASYYSSEVSKFTNGCNLACGWLTQPSVASAGQAYNQPFTHRRYLLAAALAQTDAVLGSTTYDAAALAYAQDGINQQLPTGWRAALQAPNAQGVYPPAALVAPGASVPPGTKIKVSAVGVNPENNGYDTGYQTLGLFYANTYYPYCTDAATKSKLVSMIRAGLAWENSYIDQYGNISIQGDSRMGIEMDRDGNVKVPTIPDCYTAYFLGNKNTGDYIDSVFANRLNDLNTQVVTNTVYADGAVDSNEAYSTGSSTSWSISNQKIAVEFIDRGVQTENDSIIQTGVSILNWGFNHQSADGSFGTTASPFYGVAQFVENAARAANELNNYAPKTYTPATNYKSYASGILAKCVSAGSWLTLPATKTHYDPTIATSTAREWTQAAALAETGLYGNSAAVRSAADYYALNAIKLEMSNGEMPESGAADKTYQALGMYCAEHYAATADSSSDISSANNALDSGLLWEGAYVTTSGTVSGDGSAPLLTLKNEYSAAGSLPDAYYFSVVRARLGGTPIE